MNRTEPSVSLSGALSVTGFSINFPPFFDDSLTVINPIDLRAHQREHDRNEQRSMHSELNPEKHSEEVDRISEGGPRKRFRIRDRRRQKTELAIKNTKENPMKLEQSEIPEEIYPECPVCLSTARQQDFKVFSEICLHAFCKDCLKGHIACQLNLFREIGCLEEGCPEVVREDSVIYREELSLEQKVKYYRILIHHNVNRQDYQRLCPNEHCEGYIVTNEQPVVCVICGTEYCLQCMMPRHEGDCDEHGVEFLKANMHFQRCEKCRAMVEKKQGCNHMTCRCGHQFCYLCGGTWGPNHKCKPISPAPNSPAQFQENLRATIIPQRQLRQIPPIHDQSSTAAIQPVSLPPLSQPPAPVRAREGQSDELSQWQKFLLLLGYILGLLPLDLFLILGLVGLIFASGIKDLLVGIFYRGFLTAYQNYTLEDSCPKKLFVIFCCFIVVPYMIIGVSKELSDHTHELIHRFRRGKVFFYLLSTLILPKIQ